MRFCQTCGVDTQHNFCSWDCIVAHAKANGGKVHTPNGLPIRSVDRNGNMWEHEHGDHPDYKFPVDVEYTGPIDTAEIADLHIYGVKEPSEEAARRMRREHHALVYTDGCVALTMYECNYAFFSLRTGDLIAGTCGLWKPREYRLTAESLEAVRDHVTQEEPR